jgi:hypothetical protein
MRMRWAIPIATLLLLLGCVLPVVAQDGSADSGSAGAPVSSAGLTLLADAALGGHFKFGEWLPVWAEIENDGAAREIEVQVRVAGTWGATTYARPVSLPAGAHKRVAVYVLPNNYSRALEVQIVEDGASLLARQVEVHAHLNSDYLVGIVARERGALALVANAQLKGVDRAVSIIDLALDRLPDRAEGLQSLDSLILNDVDTSTLSAEQRVALEAWVRHGGRLVLGGGAGAARVVSGLPEALVPLRAEQVVELQALPGLESYVPGQPVRVSGPFVAAAGEALGGRALATQDGVALLQERSVGQGRVDASALDLAASPFDAWAGAMPFWGQLLLADAAYASNLPPDMSARQMVSGQMSYALTNLPSLTLPSVKWLALLLGAYVLLVGPANYLLLRARGKLHWAWLTIPAITVLFSGGAFGLGYAMRGTDLILNEVAIVTLEGDGAARATTYVGLFSPAQRSYEIEVRGGGLLSPLNPESDPFASSGSGGGGETAFLQGTPARVRGLAVNQWSMQTFMSEDAWADTGRIEARIELDGDALVGTARNATRYDLKDVVLVLGMQFVRLGDLARGEEARVHLDLSKRGEDAFGAPLGYRLFQEQLQQTGPGGPPREIQLKQTVLDSVFSAGGKFSASSSRWPGGAAMGGSTGGPFVLGWFGEAPPEILVGGRRPAVQAMGLLLAPVDYRLPSSGALAIPPGLIPGTVTQMPAEGGMCGMPGSTAVYIGRGEAAFEFQLPTELALTPETLIVELGSDGGWSGPPDMAIYDWASEAWSAVDEPVLGRNLFPQPDGLVSGDGIVRIQLSSTGVRSGCYTLDVGVEGTR